MMLCVTFQMDEKQAWRGALFKNRGQQAKEESVQAARLFPRLLIPKVGEF